MKRVRAFNRYFVLRFAIALAGVTCTTWVYADNAGAHNAEALETTSGAKIYKSICQGCHMLDGKGAVGAGYYPAFSGNLAMKSAIYMATTILEGRRNMPSFKPRYMPQSDTPSLAAPASLTDVQVAAVVNYIRTHFRNRYMDSITAAEVHALHPNDHPPAKTPKPTALHAAE